MRMQVGVEIGAGMLRIRLRIAVAVAGVVLGSLAGAGKSCRGQGCWTCLHAPFAGAIETAAVAARWSGVGTRQLAELSLTKKRMG